jgi:5'-phosphate synthase pdxT subunit
VGSEVDVLARLTDNTPVAARQGRLLVSAFHPELTPDGRMHEYFLGICAGDAGRVEDSSERRRSSPESQSVMATP